jgi:hypothetical protein
MPRPCQVATYISDSFQAPKGRVLAILLFLATLPLAAQDKPYFVTYDHQMEEPGNLEVTVSNVFGAPRSGQRAFFAPLLELEYGVTGRWTTEFYLEGQGTLGDSTVLTGWRLENRFRPLKREHRFNPVLYFEYENINEASRINKEVVGHADGGQESNAELRREKAREIEGKLILGSTVRDWNISENFIVEKNLSADEAAEFGYALGVWRPLSRMATGKNCRFCRENFIAGLELYGGLGSTDKFGFRDTAQYLAPVVRWQLSDNTAIKFSPAMGLTHVSSPLLLRFGYVYEFQNFGPRMASFFRGRK